VLLLAGGVAVDYSRAINHKSQMQQAVDSAVLAAAAAKNVDDLQRIEIVKKYINANIPDSLKPLLKHSDIKIVDNKVIADVLVGTPTTLVKLMNINELEFMATSQAVIPGIKNAEVALVLDYSGSMNSKGKYQAMRDAAIDLVNTLTKNGTVTDKVKFGLVPFSHHVHLSLPGEYVVGEKAGTTWTNCTQDRKYPYNVSDVAPELANIDSKWGMSPENGYGKGAYSRCSSYTSRSLLVRPLSYDHDAVINQLNAMRPYSLTHISLGVAFGWALLSPAPPFVEGVAYDDKETEKYLIVLTDGAQTEKAWGAGKARSVPIGESNLEELCTNAKATGIKVITIAFDLKDGWTRTRLKNCASGPQYYFNANDNQALASAFKNIADELIQNVYLIK